MKLILPWGGQANPLLQLFIIGLLFLLLTGCGGEGNDPDARATPTASQAYGAQYGCPNNTVVSSPPTPPDVVILPAQNNTTITVHLKNLIEMQMPFGHSWSGPISSQGGLQLQSPYGYAWKAGQACIWRFIADKTGTSKVTFTERSLCRKGQPCSMVEILFIFTFNVIK